MDLADDIRPGDVIYHKNFERDWTLPIHLVLSVDASRIHVYNPHTLYGHFTRMNVGNWLARYNVLRLPREVT